MSPLRQQMIDAMVLRGLAARTQRAYLSVLVQLSRHYGCSPDRLDSAQAQAWLVFRIRQRHLAYATVNQAVCALKLAKLPKPQHVFCVDYETLRIRVGERAQCAWARLSCRTARPTGRWPG